MKNPFEKSWFYYCYLTFNYLHNLNGKILDLGCGNGYFISSIKNKSNELYGVDVSEQAIEAAKKRCTNVHFIKIKVGDRLPFENNYFDVVTLFHVLEHVDSEKRIIAEIFRVLKPGGLLFLSSPYSGLFTWADTANLRYRLPLLHRLFIQIFLGKGEYDRRFGDYKREKIFGDCSSNRKWHRHYRESEIKELFYKKFDILELKKFSLFMPFLLVLGNVWNYFFSKKAFLIDYIINVDNRLNCGELSYNFWLLAKKNG